jgi:glycosyltransferase involved in cell wall biosynthesis
MRAKIIFSNYDDIKNPYYAGGGSLAIHYIASQLAKDYEVWVITGKYPGAKDGVVDGVNYKRIGLDVGPKLAQLIFHFILWFYVLTTKFDVWFESFTPPFSTACLQWFTNKPVIGVTHLLGAENMQNKYKLPFSFFERLGLKTYKRVIALSQYIADKVKDSSPNTKVYVIPDGIDLSEINLDAPKNTHDYILYLGRIDVEHKGIDLLLESWKLIAHKVPVKLFIAGGGRQPDVDWLQNQIKSLGLGQTIEYKGRVDNDEKMRLMSHSMLMAMPSRFEGQGIVALEAFAHKAPLVCFDIIDLSWIRGDCAAKVPAFDTEKYADTILDLVNNPGKRTKLENNAKEFVKSFDWKLIMDEYNKLIKEVIT